MGRLGFYFDTTLCVGCRTCQVACKDLHDFGVYVNYRTVRTYETGKYPNASTYHYSASCNHCENAACVTNCPTGALSKAEDGTTQRDTELCIGCQTCVKSCPYQVPIYLEELKICGSCDACAAEREKGRNPVCVDACCMRALKWGDLDELAAEYGPDLVCDIPILPSSDMTSPSLLIKTKPAVLNTTFAQKEI